MMTDADRNAMEKHIYQALILIYGARIAQLRADLGMNTDAKFAVPSLSAGRLASIREYASGIADRIQAGVNLFLQRAVDAAKAAGKSIADALGLTKASVERYNEMHLVPELGLYATNNATVDFYQSEPDPDNPDKVLADTQLFNWNQITQFEDDCSDADAASPALLEELLGIGGGVPPVHSNCQCSLEPA